MLHISEHIALTSPVCALYDAKTGLQTQREQRDVGDNADYRANEQVPRFDCDDDNDGSSNKRKDAIPNALGE